MGLNLRGILSPAVVSPSDLRGDTVAVDAYGVFYQFLTTLRDQRGELLTDDNGNVVSHLIGLMQKTQELLEADIYPVYIFDGKPHPLKIATLDKRAEAKDKARVKLDAARIAGDVAAIRAAAGGTAYVSREMVDSATKLLAAAGLPYVMAPQDAEAQCAAMTRARQVDAAASQDYDTLVYGAPRVLRNLTSGKRDTEELLLAALHMDTGLTQEGLVDLAILVGNDFHDGIKGVGPKTALKVLARHGDLPSFFDACDRGHDCRTAVEKHILAARAELESEHVAQVRTLFHTPAVDLDASVKPGQPDATSLHERLYEVHGFSAGRSDAFASAVLDQVERRPKVLQKKLVKA